MGLCLQRRAKKLKKTIALWVLCALALAASALLYADARRVSLSAAAFSPEEEAPAAAQTMSAGDRAQLLLSGMSDREKVWQMLVVFPQDISGRFSLSDQEAWADALYKCPVGGFIMNGDNMLSEFQLKAMIAAIGGASRTPVFFCVDEEGGHVARLSYNLGLTTDFLPMFSYKDEGAERAYSNALTIARDIASFGFNVNFAPCADVWTNSENTVIGSRAYSDEPSQAAELVAAAVRGFSDGGVISTLKHFPGHGDTLEDSHFSSAYSSKSEDLLRQCELLPFIAGIEAGADMVMVGHITMTEIDPERPATMSEKLISGLLRGELGFGGVVITDSFGMAALGDFEETRAAVMSIAAGCDIILAPRDPGAVVEAILENIPARRIDESVLRILRLKIESGIIAG